MIVENERRQLPARYGNPFRSHGNRITACVRCEFYRRNVQSIEHRRLAVVGLAGCCIRPEGLCMEVRV